MASPTSLLAFATPRPRHRCGRSTIAAMGCTPATAGTARWATRSTSRCSIDQKKPFTAKGSEIAQTTPTRRGWSKRSTAYRAALREKTRERVRDQGRRDDPHRFAGSRGAAFGNQALMLALRTAGEPTRHQFGPL